MDNKGSNGTMMRDDVRGESERVAHFKLLNLKRMNNVSITEAI